MFINNEYKDQYFRLIGSRRINPITKKDGYCEHHHIIPRSWGGKDVPENMVYLTAAEHFYAHQLLRECTYGWRKGKMVIALKRMADSKRYGKILTPHEYEELRIALSEAMSEEKKGKPSPMLGKKHSAEARKRMSVANKGRVSPMKGKPSPMLDKNMPESAKNAISDYRASLTDEQKAKREAKAQATRDNRSPEYQAKINATISKNQSGENNNMYGKKHSEETRKLLSERAKESWRKRKANQSKK